MAPIWKKTKSTVLTMSPPQFKNASTKVVLKIQRQRGYGSKTSSVADRKCWSGNPNRKPFSARRWTGGRGEQFTENGFTQKTT